MGSSNGSESRPRRGPKPWIPRPFSRSRGRSTPPPDHALATRLLFASRRDLAVPIAVEVAARAAAPRVEYATNLSIGGLCLHAREALPVGEGVAIAFVLPGGGPRIEARGRVIWLERAQADAAPRFLETGIRFEVLADGDRERLARFVRDCDPDAPAGG